MRRALRTSVGRLSWPDHKDEPNSDVSHVTTKKNSSFLRPRDEVEAVEGEYARLTTTAVGSFMKKRKDIARRIAEKFGEYDALIQICADTQDTESFNYYLKKFADTEFPVKLFQWYRHESK